MYFSFRKTTLRYVSPSRDLQISLTVTYCLSFLNSIGTLTLAMMVKLALRKAELPTASTIRIKKLSPTKAVRPVTLSSNPKSMQQVPVVRMPMLKTLLAPNRLKCFPINGLTKKTVSSNIPNTRPYSVAVAPLLWASAIYLRKKVN